MWHSLVERTKTIGIDDCCQEMQGCYVKSRPTVYIIIYKYSICGCVYIEINADIND